MKIKVFLLGSILLMLLSEYCRAQISLKYEYISFSSYWLDKGENPRERIGNAEGSATVYQGSANIPLSVKQDSNKQPIIWGVGLNGTHTSLHNKNFSENLVIAEIMNIALGVYHLRPLNERWSLMASLGAGIYMPSLDLAKVSVKHVLGSMSAIFIYRFNQNFELGGGVAVNSTFGYPMAFPAIHLNWNLQGQLDFLLSMSNGLEVSAGLDIGKFFRLSLIGEMSGQSALMRKDDKDVIFTHQYIVTGLRPEFKIGKKISIPITAGINAVRPAYFSDRTLKAMFESNQDYYFQISPYLSTGAIISF